MDETLSSNGKDPKKKKINLPYYPMNRKNRSLV